MDGWQSWCRLTLGPQPQSHELLGRGWSALPAARAGAGLSLESLCPFFPSLLFHLPFLSLVIVFPSLFLQACVPGPLSLPLSFPRLSLGSCHSLKLPLLLWFPVSSSSGWTRSGRRKTRLNGPAQRPGCWGAHTPWWRGQAADGQWVGSFTKPAPNCLPGEASNKCEWEGPRQP